MNPTRLLLILLAFFSGGFISTLEAQPGILDLGFGVNGRVLTPVHDSGTNVIGVIEQPDGKIVLGGYNYGSSSLDIWLHRYKYNGKLDSSFGVNGIATFTSSGDVPTCIALQPDGKIVMGHRE